MTKSWRVEHCLPIARETYAELEARFGEPLYHAVPARRYFQTEDDAKRAGRRSRNPRYADVLGPPLPPGARPTPLRDPAGSIPIRQAGWVDLPRLLALLRECFAATGDYLDAVFDYGQLRPADGGWAYREDHADRVIFCEGAGLRDNPWFRQLPLTPVKGETLALRCASLELDPGIYHSRKWLLAYGQGRFRLGATYDETDLSHQPTESGKQELLDDAAHFIPAEHPLHIEQHLAGLRPATPDSKPLLGAHPDHPRLFIFNGLGSKGAATAPWLSHHLLDHLQHDHPLDPAVNLHRFPPPNFSPVETRR